MTELNPLIKDLTFIFLISGIFSIFFKWLKQPIVLSYIVAGIAISFLLREEKMKYKDLGVWSDIGVIFLLFGLGLEFSFKKLIKVGPSASISAIIIVLLMILVGYFIGTCFKWSNITSIFLGAMLCMSSTMIIIKVFDDLRISKQKFASIVLGILIIEDLIAVVLMVLLSTIAISRKLEGISLLYSLIKLGGFLLFWFILGIYLIPMALRKAKTILNNEILLILSISLCLGMVFLATHAGYSSALGAFVMGSILAETIEGEKIEKMLFPIKNLFGVLFFVSIGRLVNISTIGTYLIPIVIISLIVILGQSIFATIGVMLAGQDLKTAICSGFSLAQIGEFSYIIGSLGLKLGVIEQSLYQVIVCTSIITIFFTPYMMKSAPNIYQFLKKKLPKKYQNYINRNTSSQLIKDENLWRNIIKDILKTTTIYLPFTIIIILLLLKYGCPFVQKYLPGFKGNLMCSILIILFISPFIQMLIFRNNNSSEFKTLWNTNEENKIRLLFTIILRIVICIGLIMYILVQLLSIHPIVAFVTSLLIISVFLTSKKLRKHSNKLERYWVNNLNEKEAFKRKKMSISKGFSDKLLERDLHLSDFKIEYYYSIIGETLQELNMRKRFGIEIVTIIRDNRKINIPKQTERIYPNDHLIAFGTDKQMEDFQLFLEQDHQLFINKNNQETINKEVLLQQFEISNNSTLVGLNIISSQMQEKYNCLLVGLERDNTSTLEVDLTMNFEKGDILWIVGEYEGIKKLKQL